LRIANTVGAAITHHRVLGDTESGPVLAGALAAIVVTAVLIFWPAVIAWPLALIGAWFAVNLSVNWFTLRRQRKQHPEEPAA
jgi:cardiolipin synthase